MMKKSMRTVLLTAVSTAALSFAIAMAAEAEAAGPCPGKGGGPSSAVLPASMRIDPAILATGERVKDLSDMRNPLPS